MKATEPGHISLRDRSEGLPVEKPLSRCAVGIRRLGKETQQFIAKKSLVGIERFFGLFAYTKLHS